MESRGPFDCPLSPAVCESGPASSQSEVAFTSLLQISGLTYLACPVQLPALVMVLLAVRSLALPVFSLASSKLTGLILTYKHASGVVNDQLGQALTPL